VKKNKFYSKNINYINIYDKIIMRRKMEKTNNISWLESLSVEDADFIKSFVLASGSLKQLAVEYKVSYPTLRLRLDRLIQKINLLEKSNDTFITTIKSLALDDKITIDVARELIQKYRSSKEKGEKENEEKTIDN
jgi:hypothetical protein